MKMKPFNYGVVVVIAVIALVYTDLLALTGIFGVTLQNIFVFFDTKILPYIAIGFGYFLAVFIPVRILQAKERNKQALDNFLKEQKLKQHANNEKEMTEQILKLLNEEDRI